MNPFGNPFLLAATVGALGADAVRSARRAPGRRTWLRVVAVASVVVLVSELFKLRGMNPPKLVYPLKSL